METESVPQGRLLGLDVGARTIGLAVSDPLGYTAQGLPTWRRQNMRKDMEALRQVIVKYGVLEIVVGKPLHLSGAETRGSARIIEFGEKLKHHFGLPVHLWDERLTTAQAQRVLRDAEMSIARRAQVVDQLAAVLILQSFMENRQARQIP